ncbi:MAG TPA: hypothetical protein VK589_22800 [Chryseolinea sp.]|nr:hypothetical protein [Chryseolinea sp.]
MKKLVVHMPIVLIALLALSCNEKDCCAGLEKEGSKELAGDWLLYERGYSPGAGYVIEPVSVNPPQIIEFKTNGELSCSVSGLTDYKFYSVKGDVVGLFKNDPGPSPDSLAFTHSYNFSFEGGNLKLGFRYCYEGCHLGFKKVE